MESIITRGTPPQDIVKAEIQVHFIPFPSPLLVVLDVLGLLQDLSVRKHDFPEF